MIHQHHGLEGRDIAIELLELGGDSLEKALILDLSRGLGAVGEG